MEREQIIRMAREVLLLDRRDNPNDDGIAQFIGTLSDFAALVAAAERNECAKIVEGNADGCDGPMERVLRSNAAAIRARGQAGSSQSAKA